MSLKEVIVDSETYAAFHLVVGKIFDSLEPEDQKELMVYMVVSAFEYGKFAKDVLLKVHAGSLRPEVIDHLENLLEEMFAICHRAMQERGRDAAIGNVLDNLDKKGY